MGRRLGSFGKLGTGRVHHAQATAHLRTSHEKLLLVFCAQKGHTYLTSLQIGRATAHTTLVLKSSTHRVRPIRTPVAKPRPTCRA